LCADTLKGEKTMVVLQLDSVSVNLSCQKITSFF